MQLLSKAIHGILTANTDITDSVGSGNIWHTKIPQRTTSGSDAPVNLSIYFYTFALDPVGSNKSGASEVDAHKIRVVIVGKDDADMSQVAQYVRYALDRIEPGFYSGIHIQGSEFLNASFDPEGSYELENQSWVLEFSFRVIDNDIRSYQTRTEMNYSLTEQVWPYSKHLSGETIYWRTWELGIGVGGYVALTGLTSAIVAKIVDVKFLPQNNVNEELIIISQTIADAAVLKYQDDVWKAYTIADYQLNTITAWYTKN